MAVASFCAENSAQKIERTARPEGARPQY